VSPRAPRRVGVIGRSGAGNYGHQLDLAFTRDPRAEVVAVADPDDAGRADCLRRVGAPAGYADYHQMLAREGLDIVVVAPRDLDCHAEMTLAAIGSGAHVYCEKPIAPTLAEADQMVAAADAAGVRLAIALPAVHEPRLQTLREHLDSGKLGEVLQLRALCKWDHRGGGQDFLILGVHFADLMRRLAGDAMSCYARVRVGDRGITRSDAQPGDERAGLVAGDRIWAGYSFASGVMGTIESWRCGIEERDRQPYRLEVYGTRGMLMLRAPYADHSLWYCDDPAFLPGRSRWQRIETEPVATYGDYHRAAAADFLDALDQDREPLCTGSDGRAALEMIAAAYHSQLRGGPVALPLADRAHPLAPDGS
jgi:predicted dehydrogenase